MQSKHREKYLTKLLFGIAFVSSGIFGLLYLFKNQLLPEDWYLWGFAIAIFINTGLILIGNAFVHKIKSDLIRKQKQKQQHQHIPAE